MLPYAEGWPEIFEKHRPPDTIDRTTRIVVLVPLIQAAQQRLMPRTAVSANASTAAAAATAEEEEAAPTNQLQHLICNNSDRVRCSQDVPIPSRRVRFGKLYPE